MEGFPRRFGPYVLIKPLARGGMGALYLALSGEKGLEKLCVLKTALPHLLGQGYGQRFRDEASVVVRLSHGNLVTVFDAGQVEGEIFIAMDFVDGKDLRAVWNRCAQKGVAFPVDIAVHVVKELARGLGYVHGLKGLGLVHRDISPPNVLVSYTGEVKITDFGLAWSTLKLEKTAPGIIFGKVSYMAPEQARGEPIDGRVDIYATGIILWELLTGRQLFPAPAGSGTDDEVLETVRKPTIQPPSSRASRVPRELDAIVMKALHPDPAQRYQTGEDFRSELAAFQARTSPATDGDQVARFLKGLFGDTIGQERSEREELLGKATSLLSIPTKVGAHLPALRAENGKNGNAKNGPSSPPPLPPEASLGTIDTSSMTGPLSTNDAPSKLVGQMLAGRYSIKRLIGEGGMGRVYEAEHVEIGRRVAVKVLHPAYSRTPEVVERFRREARAASKVGHPNIVDVTDSGTTEDGSFFFVMEFVEGAELGLVIFKQGPMTFARALHIAAQMCDALESAHQGGIIHRDLKPENVLLITREGHPDFVKVLDFGIAKNVDVEETAKNGRRLTRPGVAMGTPEYMAPEQAAGKPADPRSDIYAVGSIMYEMLSGNPPYDGDNVMEVLHKKANQPPAPLKDIRPDLPIEVIELVDRAMARNPASRPQTMAAMAADLRALAAQLGAETPPPQVAFPQPRRTSREQPIMAGQISGGPPQALLGLPRRAFAVGTTILSMVILLVVVRASRNRPGSVGDAAAGTAMAATAPLSSLPPPSISAPVVEKAPEEPRVYGPPLPPPSEAPPTSDASPTRVRGTGQLAAADRKRMLEEAKTLLWAQRFDEARAVYDKLLEKKPRQSSALLGLAQVAFQENKYPEAAKRAQQSVAAGGGIEALLVLGDAHFRLSQYPEARKAYVKALEINPTHEVAKRMLDLVQRRLQ
ncbi:MAG TPA: protein kinase [Polyangia bacterium]